MENHSYPEFLLSCEHAGNEIPEPYKNYFLKAGDALKSHLGWDPGAAELAEEISETMNIPLFSHSVSRLLIETNRSLNHPQLFSDFTGHLPELDKRELIEKIYLPHRKAISDFIMTAIENKRRIVHTGIHTFTHELKGERRDFDIGLLFDPSRYHEQRFCTIWQKKLEETDTSVKVRENQPYKGIDDGLTTELRHRFSEEHYLGIELEVNHKHYFSDSAEWERLCRSIVESFRLTVEEFRSA